MTRFIAMALALVAGAATAQEAVNIQPDMMSITVETPSGPVEISRIQDNANMLEGEWARTSRPCPNFCIQPMVPAPGVTPIGELEMLEFLQDPDVVVIDGRIPRDYATGAIPGAVNVPFSTLEPSNPYRDDILRALGARQAGGGRMDFSQARDLLMFCNGPWCDQSPRAIRNLIDAG